MAIVQLAFQCGLPHDFLCRYIYLAWYTYVRYRRLYIVKEGTDVESPAHVFRNIHHDVQQRSYPVLHGSPQSMIFLQRRSLFPLQLILREILIQNDLTKVFSGTDAISQMDLYKPLVQYCTTIVATAPILCIYPFVQKCFVKGVMIGSLKG